SSRRRSIAQLPSVSASCWRRRGCRQKKFARVLCTLLSNTGLRNTKISILQRLQYNFKNSALVRRPLKLQQFEVSPLVVVCRPSTLFLPRASQRARARRVEERGVRGVRAAQCPGRRVAAALPEDGGG